MYDGQREHIFCSIYGLKDLKLPKMKSRLFTCPCHKICWGGALGTSLSNNCAFKTTIVVSTYKIGPISWKIDVLSIIAYSN